MPLKKTEIKKSKDKLKTWTLMLLIPENWSPEQLLDLSYKYLEFGRKRNFNWFKKYQSFIKSVDLMVMVVWNLRKVVGSGRNEAPSIREHITWLQLHLS